MEPSDLDSRIVTLRNYTIVVTLVGLFQLCFIPAAIHIQPLMMEDALRFELEGLDCKTEAIQRIVAWKERIKGPAVFIPFLNGLVLLSISAAIFYQVSQIKRQL
ncbi:hypothetical protein [Gimesia algae]|uniref:Uncharacterized protein n=1 Tax=Gimesia algae TaxID=2527971 RepID=A0A517VK60_9PLAN|nr:hypothetical protein [Gimesia algae]QDT93403.1 hypothetical protein Pan161_50820 [Gimesia algae]